MHVSVWPTVPVPVTAGTLVFTGGRNCDKLAVMALPIASGVRLPALPMLTTERMSFVNLVFVAKPGRSAAGAASIVVSCVVGSVASAAAMAFSSVRRFVFPDGSSN